MILASDFEADSSNFSASMETLATLVDFTRITTADLLMQLAAIPSVSASIKAIHTQVSQTFAALFQNPKLLDSTYTDLRLVYDLFDFFAFAAPADFPPCLRICLAALPDTSPAYARFNEIFEIITDNVYVGPIEDSYRQLSLLESFLGEPKLCATFVHHPHFPHLIIRLFSQSSFATDSVYFAQKYFGDTPRQASLLQVQQMDADFDRYHLHLAALLTLLLGPRTWSDVTKHFPTWLGHIEHLSKSRFIYTTPRDLPRVEAFGLNFEAVIVKLAIRDRDKVPEINPFTPHLPGSAVPAGSATLSDVSDADAAEWAALLEANQTVLPHSVLFFLAGQCLESCSTGLLQLYKLMARQLARCRQASDSGPEPARMMFRPLIETLDRNMVVMNANLLRHSKVRDFVIYARAVLDYLLLVGRISAETIGNKPTPAFAHTPECVFISVISMLVFYVANAQWEEPALVALLSKLVLFFGNQQLLKSTICKARIVEVFSAVARSQTWSHVVPKPAHVLDLMFPALLEFYCAVQVTGANATLFDRFHYRIACSDLLLSWFAFSDFQTAFKDRHKDKVFSDFVFYLVDDTMYFADQCREALRLVSTTLRDRQAHADDESHDHAELMGELSQASQNLSHWVVAVQRAIELMSCLMLFAPFVFHDSVILDELTKIILSFMDLYVHQMDALAQIQNFDRSTLLMAVVKICVAVVDQAQIVDYMCGNQMFAAAPLAAELIPSAQRWFPDVLARKFARVAEVLRERSAELASQAVDYSDAPEEFLDGITCELMAEPMRLPSGHYMDLQWLKKSLLTKPVDPFTMKALTIEQCTLDEELQKRIVEYRERKRQERTS
jgi:hypothetical protein